MTRLDDTTKLSTSFKVGGYRCDMSLLVTEDGHPASLHAQWAPSMPRRLSRRAWAAYRRGRDAFLAELALVHGPVACLEGNGSVTIIKPVDLEGAGGGQ